MAQPRPSLTLVLDIDERLDTEELRLEVNRCYNYVGSALVRTHPASEGEPENTMRFLVKLGTRKYLHSSDEGADELWNDVMERWFYNELHKVGNNMKIFNSRQRDIGAAPLMFDWIEVDLENGSLSVLLHCDDASGIDPAASTLLTTLRTALNEGILATESTEDAAGTQPTRVFMPSRASFADQFVSGMAAKAQREAAEKAARAEAEEAQRAAQAAAEQEADQAFLESPELLASQEEVAAAPDAAPEEAADPFAVDEPNFAIDYQLWSIEYPDGSVRTYDSSAERFVD